LDKRINNLFSHEKQYEVDCGIWWRPVKGLGTLALHFTTCRSHWPRRLRTVFLNRRAATRYRALASINHTGQWEAWGNYNMLQDFISPIDN